MVLKLTIAGEAQCLGGANRHLKMEGGTRECRPDLLHLAPFAVSHCLLNALPWSCAADCVPGPGMLGCRHHHCNEGGQSLSATLQ